MPEESSALRYLRDKLKDKLMTELDEVYINGTMEHRLPHNLNISFAYVEGEIAADGHQRYRGFERIGLHFGDAGAQLRSEGSGRGRRSGALLHPLRPGPLQHRRRSGLRRPTK